MFGRRMREKMDSFFLANEWLTFIWMGVNVYFDERSLINM